MMKNYSRPHFEHMKNLLKCKRSKKGWIRTVEAFIAIMMIFAVLLIIISRQGQQENYREEIIKLQGSIINQISQDDILRSEILSNNISKTEKYIADAIPSNINFSVNVCNYLSVCPNPINYSYIRDREVYSDEVLIAANLTYFNESNAKKLKLFFWEEK